MLEDYYKPFEDFDNAGVKNIFTRVFKKSVKKEQLLWHKDKKDRKPKGYFTNITEVEQAIESKNISLHSEIICRFMTKF